jgi:hypothetical protein
MSQMEKDIAFVLAQEAANEEMDPLDALDAEAPLSVPEPRASLTLGLADEGASQQGHCLLQKGGQSARRRPPCHEESTAGREMGRRGQDTLVASKCVPRCWIIKKVLDGFHVHDIV